MSSGKISSLNGIFAVNKTKGETSAATVARIKTAILSNAEGKERKALGRRLKVGHGGTLDPMATGVLVIGLGSGCKALQDFLKGTKGYRAVGRFGTAFDTLDCTGVVVEERPVDLGTLSREAFQAILDTKFTGDILQRPPAFSAVHVDGKRAYELARANKPVDIPPRPVHVEHLSIIAWGPPSFTLEIGCGGGTYVRSLIADSAAEYGQLAAMYELERTKQGPFTLDDCVDVEVCKDLGQLKAIIKTL